MENYKNIPLELQKVNNWVCWKFEERNGKKTKIPKNPYNGNNAQSNNEKTWSSFDQAIKSCSHFKFDGIGFMFTAPYFGVDLDKCIENKEFVDEFVNSLDSYTEYSISKTGVHVICKGKLPEGRRRKGIVEMYEKERFFVMTGNIYGSARYIKDCTESIKSLHSKYVHTEKQNKQRSKTYTNIELSENDVLNIAFRAKNGRDIERLYRGDFSTYPSQSEADLALCNHLAFYTQGDFQKIDNLFRSSGLMREKWDEMRGATTYGQKAINEAIDNCREFYKPKDDKIDILEDFVLDLENISFPFVDDVYRYVVNIESELEREKLKMALEEIARKSGAKNSQAFNKIYKIFEKEKPRAKDEENKVTNYNIQNELYCGNWIADINGIRAFHNNTEIKASNTAIYPIKLMKNMQSKEQKAKIAFYDKGKWQELFVEKDMLLVSSKVVNLAKYGVLVTSDWAKHLTNYFAEVFQKNHFQEFLSTSKMGWENKYKSFLPITPSDLELDTHISFSSMVNSLEPKGDKEEYLKFIKKILTGERKEPKIALIASLASVLVQPLGCLSFILHIYGQAGIGKTLITKMCAGVWGNPIENGFLIDPKNTPTSFEIILNLLNNLPFIADDINKINFTPWFTQRDLNYLLCSGSGKQRSNVKLTIEEVKTWKNLSILNGEKALTTEDSHGGELLRTVELQLEPKAIFKDGNKVAEFLHNNYGFLGKMFIEYIIEYDQIEQAKGMKQEFTQKVIDTYGNSKEGKQIESLGLLYATQDIVCSMLGVERTLDFEDFASMIKDIDDVLDTKRACKIISDIIEQNFSSFVDDTIKYTYNETPHIPNVKWGWKISDSEVLIIPNQFNELCKKANIDRRLFLEWCVKEKVLDVGSGKDFSKVVKIKCENKTYRGYKFKLEQFE